MKQTPKQIPYCLSKDILVKIGLDLKLSTLFNFCNSCKRFNRLISNNQSFWYNRYLSDFNCKYTGRKTLVDIKYRYNIISYWWNPKNHYCLTDDFILNNPELKNMTTLFAYSNHKITDKSVKELKSLTFLNADLNNKITDKSVKELDQLITLDASCNESITDESIRTLKNLTILFASKNSKITDETISQLPNIAKVYR